MRKIISIFTIALLVSCSGVAQKPEKKKEKKYDIVKTEEQWKKELTSIQYYVLREAGT